MRAEEWRRRSGSGAANIPIGLRHLSDRRFSKPTQCRDAVGKFTRPSVTEWQRQSGRDSDF